MASLTDNTRLRRAFDRHLDAVSRYCLRRSSPEDAADAVAQTFAVAWRKIDQMPKDELVLPWLYRIASYELRTIHRSSRRATSLRHRLAGEPEYVVASPESLVVQMAERDAVLAALRTMSPSDREIILLRSYEELSTSEIAMVVGCSEVAARKRLSRALMRLERAVPVATPPSGVKLKRTAEEGGTS